MTELISALAVLLTAAAVVAGGAALAATRQVTVALPVFLDLLLAASLLRLTVHPSYTQLAATALLVGIKRLVSFGLRTAVDARRHPTES